MTPWIKTLVTLNLIGGIFSVALFVATWFAQGYVVRQARQIALESARGYLEPVVKFMESPKLTQRLPVSVEEKLSKEIMDYRESPDQWLLEIVEGSRDRAADFEFPEIRNPLARKGFVFLTDKLRNARQHFDNSFANLILDLRIFSATNACAFGVALWLCLVAKTRKMRRWLSAWSAILLISTLIATWIYIGQNWRWNILFNDYFGWFYPALHLCITIYLIVRLLPDLEAGTPVDDD